MSNYCATFKDVRRSVFDKVSDRIENHEEAEVKMHITVYYNGTTLRADLKIEGYGGYGLAYKKASHIFNEEYCDWYFVR